MAMSNGTTNLFKSKTRNKELNFRNETDERDNVTSVEIRTVKGAYCVGMEEIVIDPKDNVAMALSILGVGRLTPEVEELAKDAMRGRNEAELIQFAIINLRAALLLREQEEAESQKDLDDAYALYKLSYPRAIVTRETFTHESMSQFWLSNLRKLRQDPTVLGAL
jgi:hypothetical protein